MRLLPVLLALPLLALPLLALQAHAQTAPPLQAIPPAGIPAPAGSAPNALATASPEHHRMTWKQRFAQANIAHDGHLTLPEANGGYPTMARHFKEIDADKKGYVTEEDVTTWHKLQRALHHSNQGGTGDALRPRPAFQRGGTTPQRINTSTKGTALPMTQPDAN